MFVNKYGFVWYIWDLVRSFLFWLPTWWAASHI